MLVLLDQGTPVPLGRHLSGHTVRTASQQGWATLGNGDLLAVAEAEGFDVFVTTDKNLRYQQKLSGRRMAVVVILYPQWPGLEPFVNLVVAAVEQATPGSYREVEIPVR
jgi:hypothetical protein